MLMLNTLVRINVKRLLRLFIGLRGKSLLCPPYLGYSPEFERKIISYECK